MIHLTPEQRRILDAPGSKKVIAPAGSGKTFVLVEQCVRWAEQHDPSATAALTFTRRAADSLRRKLADRDVELGFIGTVHAFCFVTMWRWGWRLGYRPGPRRNRMAWNGWLTIRVFGTRRQGTRSGPRHRRRTMRCRGSRMSPGRRRRRVLWGRWLFLD